MVNITKGGREASLASQSSSSGINKDEINRLPSKKTPVSEEETKHGRKTRMQLLPWSTLLGYAAPMIGAGGMNFTLTTYSSYFYTDTIGVSPDVVGNIQLVLMIMYAVSEPIFGWVSDISSGWLFQRLGRRKPYIIVSSLLYAATFFFLTGPPTFLSIETGIVSWAFLLATMLGMSWGCNEVTYHAMGLQLTFDYDERSKVQAMAVSAITLGSTTCSLLHGILGTVLGPSVEAQRMRFIILGATFSGLFLLGTILLLWLVKDEMLDEAIPQPDSTFSQWIMMGLESLKQMVLNIPFFILILAYTCMLMAGAVTPMMLPYFSKNVLQSRFATDWAPLIFTASAILGMPFWVYLGSSYVGLEKKWRFSICAVWMALFLGLSAGTVSSGDGMMFTVFSVLIGLAMGGYFSIPEAMKPDVVDYDEFRTGGRHEARFAGLFMLFANVMAGVAMKVMLLLMGRFGYDGSAPIGQTQPASAILTIRLGFGATLGIFSLIILPLMYFYPITRRTHRRIVEATQRRLEGDWVADPIYGGEPLPPFTDMRLLADETPAETLSDTTFLQQVERNVGAMAGTHGDRGFIRNVM